MTSAQRAGQGLRAGAGEVTDEDYARRRTLRVGRDPRPRAAPRDGLGRRVHADHERRGVAGTGVAGQGRHLEGAAVIAEHVVGGEGDLGEVAGRAVVGGQCVDLIEHVLGERQLRDGDGPGGVGDVAPHDSGLLQHVGSVGTVAGVGAGGLVGDLRRGQVEGGRRGRGARLGGGARRGGRRRGRAGNGRAGREGRRTETEADQAQDAAAAHERAEVERGALIDDLLVRAVEEPPLVRRAVGGLVGFGDARHGEPSVRRRPTTVARAQMSPLSRRYEIAVSDRRVPAPR